MTFPDRDGRAIEVGDVLQGVRGGEMIVVVTHILEKPPTVVVWWGRGFHGWLENSTEWVVIRKQETMKS